VLVSEYRSGSLEDSLLTVVYVAYDQSLKRHHNWLMRGTFYVRLLRHRQPVMTNIEGCQIPGSGYRLSWFSLFQSLELVAKTVTQG